MTISNTSRIAGPFLGNGATTDFPFGFKVFSTADMLVVLTAVSTGISIEQVLNLNYYVVLNTDQNANPGGTIKMLTAPTTGTSLVVTSDMDVTQTLDLTNSGGFYPSVINAALDRVVILIQQLYGALARTVRFPLSDGSSISELPAAGARAGKLLGFDSNGNFTAVVPADGSASSVLSSLSQSIGAGLIGYGTTVGLTVARQLDILSSLHVNVREPRFAGGSKGDGTNATAAFQAALDFVRDAGGGYVDVPKGAYNLTATLTTYNNVKLVGAGWTSTRLTRSTAYGDTIYQNTGKIHVEGFYITHSDNPQPGATSLKSKLTDGSAHIRAVNTQEGEIAGNILARMPYPVILDGAINPKVHHNWLIGIWDPLYPQMQEGIADLLLIGTTQHVQLAYINFNYFSGAVNNIRNTTYTDGSNSVTKNYNSNIGSRNNLLVYSGEDVSITHNYFGRASEQLIRLVPGGVLLNVQISNNQLDNAGSGGMGVQIGVDSSISGASILSLIIENNNFDGEYDTNNAIVISASAAPAQPTVTNLRIANNSMYCHTATPVILQGANNAQVFGNVIQSYNAIQVALESGTNRGWNSAIWVTGVSSYVSVFGNTIGGGGNNAGAAGNYCYYGVNIDSVGISNTSRDNFYTGIAVGSNFRFGTTRDETQYVHSAAGNYQMVAGSAIYIRAKPTSEISQVNLPVYPMLGCEAVVIDDKGDAAAFNLLVGTGDGTTINGAVNYNMNTNFAVRRFRFNGTRWNVIG